MTSSASPPSRAEGLRRYSTVPCLWPGGTIVCVGSGPSLTAADVAACRGQHVLMVNDAYRLAPWADILYAADSKWWRWHRDVPDAQLPALLYTIDPLAAYWRPSVQLLNYRGYVGLEDDPGCVRTGGHGGYQAINVAVHLVGPGGRILLLGYDMMPGVHEAHHFFGEHPDGHHPNYAHRLGAYASLVAPLAERRITIVNCSRRSAITVFPQQSLDAALAAG